MRGGFLLGAIVGAAATTYIITRRNSNMNMARIGTMVSKAIGDGFQTMTSTSETTSQSSQQNTNQSSSASKGKQAKQQSQQSKQQSQQSQAGRGSEDTATQEQLKQMIAKDASVQNEVNKILSENTH